ncbi:hypothetical protein C6W92_03485 [Roseovarius sp. A46]|uniref:hypothetical protein n=1 Tax=Roseovarius sp. A46 TaxID=2109331 RepID=UPI000E7D9B8B|nr:hypothetical protein [Roseovarius sp. A46]RXV66540.1 hypothetical protein C6W92_03485 [Roseovarius sp. A46]HAW47454.1 hypothetical protein [Roseovarius sp.]|tara:strand:+ start:145 stop:366 length:222 start_codon:yes stop_codon:yes gene_type:complete
MTNIATNISVSPLRGAWGRFVAGLERGCERMARTRSRRGQIEALEAKSDQELARLGIPRDQIAYHVFKDLFYT